MSISVAISSTGDACAMGRRGQQEAIAAMPALIRINPTQLPVSADAVEVWLLATDQHGVVDRLADLLALLSRPEQARSARFLRPADRCSYIATRAALRMVLSSTVGVAPEAIKLDQNSWGKPVLAAGQACQDLDFSVSHSGNLSAIAVSGSGAIGIDIEHCRPVSRQDRIIADLLGDGAASALARLPMHRQSEAFLRLWTSAEAMMKAAGTGLAGTQGPVPLALSADGRPQVLPDRELSGVCWALHAFDPAPGFVGSLVVEAVDHFPVS
jgi:phosphopantetheinyl transferase